MRRPIVRKGRSASIGTMKLVHILEQRLEVERACLDVALDFGLDILAKNATVKVIRLVREIDEKGGLSASIFHVGSAPRLGLDG